MRTLIALLALVPSLAFATKQPPQLPVQEAPPTAIANGGYADSYSQSASSSASNSSSYSVSDNAATSTASNGGNTQAINVINRRSAASAHADAGYSSAPCTRDQRAGVQLVGFGVSGGRGKADKDCLLNAAADAELARGNVFASVKLRCRVSYYAETLGEDCQALLETQTATPAAPKPESAAVACQNAPTKDYATKEELDRAFRGCVGK